MSIKDFLEQPLDSCRTTLVLGKPGSGKSWTVLRSFEYWLEKNYFTEAHVILPSYHFEQQDSYKFIRDYKGGKDKTKIKVYKEYHQKFGHEFVEAQEKLMNSLSSSEERDKHKKLLILDDTTHQTSQLFNDKSMVKLATMSRHLRTHVIVIMHHSKGVIPPKVRLQTSFYFCLKLSEASWYDIFKSDFDFPKDFPAGKKGFEKFFARVQQMYDDHKNGCLLIDSLHNKYNFNVAHWFN